MSAHGYFGNAARRLDSARHSMAESELIARAVAGDGAAQRALYDAHVDRVYRLAFRLAGDDDMARDFTQETFIRAFDRLEGFRRESAFSTWLYAIAMSVTLNGLRSVKRLRTREVALDAAETLGTGRAPVDPDLRERLHRAIDGLPPGYRAVFVMHDVEGFTHEEIGEALGIQIGTSKAQLFRARAKLREVLADFAGAWSA
jgi:RNA polymerase sigma-70 factor (ECF subfamily)